MIITSTWANLDKILENDHFGNPTIDKCFISSLNDQMERYGYIKGGCAWSTPSHVFVYDDSLKVKQARAKAIAERDRFRASIGKAQSQWLTNWLLSKIQS